MLRTILAVLFAVCYLILGIPVLFVEWLIGKKNPHLRDISSLRMVQWAFRVIYRICGVKLTIIGQENVPKDTPVLYVANHNSYFDIIITYALCENLTGYIAKDSLEKVPLLNIWMKRLYCGDSDEMAPFKEGSLKIAEKAGCPIIPMAITHTRDIIKDHIPFVKPTHVTIQYGTPVYPNELPKEEKRALGRYTQNIIQEMLDHEKAGSL